MLADRRPLRFRHELLRGAVLAGMPAGEQAIARAAAVELLREHGAEPERIAAADALTLRQAAARASARGARLRRGTAAPCARGAARARRAGGGPDGARGGRAEPRASRGHRSLHGGRADRSRRSRAPYRRGIAAGHAAALDPSRSAAALRLLDAIELPSGDRLLAVRVINARLAAASSDAGRFHGVASEADALAPITGATPDERRLLAHLARARLEGGSDAGEVATLAERATDLEAVADPDWFVTLIVALTATDRYVPSERLAQRAVERARERGR